MPKVPICDNDAFDAAKESGGSPAISDLIKARVDQSGLTLAALNEAMQDLAAKATADREQRLAENELNPGRHDLKALENVGVNPIQVVQRSHDGVNIGNGMQRVLLEPDRVNRKWESELMMEGPDKRQQEKRGYEVALHLISKELDAEGQPIGEQRAAALLAELGADEVIGITPAQLQQACWKVQCLQNPALEAHLEAGKAEVEQALQQAGLEPVDPQEYHQQAAALIEAGGRYPELDREIKDNERILQRNPDIAKMELGDAKERLKKCENRVADLEKPSRWERFKAFVKGPSCAEKLQSYQSEAVNLRAKVDYEAGIQEKNEVGRNGRQLLDQVRELQARNLAVARIENQVKAAQVAQFQQQQQLQQQNQIAQNQKVAVGNEAEQHAAEGAQQGVPDQAHQQKMKNVMEELQGVKAQKEKQYKPGQTGVALASSNAKSQQQQIKNELQELEAKKMVSKTKI